MFIVIFILFILLLSAIIVVHEFGHLIAAKVFKVYCPEFSIGMGPKLCSFKGKETEYCLRALPVGGFVAMAGDTDNSLETSVDTTNIPLERTLPGIAKWKRAIIMMAGVIMNMVLAVVIVALVLLYNGSYAVSPEPLIGAVQENTPAYRAGLKQGDLITRLEYQDLGISSEPKTFDDIGTFTYGHENEVLTITVERDGESLSFDLQAEFNEESNSYLIGISSPGLKAISINLFNCWYYAIDYLWYVVRTIFMSLGQLLKGVGLENLSGPVGIYQATEEAISMGAQSYILMIAVLSVNVGIINALPLPILDGGRVLILIIEALIGRPLSEKAISYLMGISLFLILALFVFATYQDILRLL